MSYRRARGDVIEVYKYTHDYYNVNKDLLPLDNDRTTITRGHPFKLKKQYCRTRTSIRQNFFPFRVVESWNSLPSAVVTAPSLNSFKNRLDKVWAEHTYTSNLHFPLPPARVDVDELICDDEQEQLTGN